MKRKLHLRTSALVAFGILGLFVEPLFLVLFVVLVGALFYGD